MALSIVQRAETTVDAPVVTRDEGLWAYSYVRRESPPPTNRLIT